MRRGRVFLALALLAGFAPRSGLLAQQVTLQQPLHSVNESFFERFGTQWSLNFPGGFVNFGGGLAVPPFGGFNPAAGSAGGWAFRQGNLNGQFNFAAGQGVQRSFVSQTPVLTLTNGAPGYVADASVSPFVMGFIPVVGNSYPGIPMIGPGNGNAGVGSDAVRAALRQARSGQGPGGQAIDPAAAAHAAGAPAAPPRQRPVRPADDLVLAGPGAGGALAGAAAPAAGRPARSADRPVPSVAEARRMHAVESSQQDHPAETYWERGQSAERAGNLGAARVYYQMAARRATGDLKRRAMERLTALKGPSAAER